MRTAFIQQLIEEAKINDKVFLLVADLGYGVVESFARQFPDRFLNVGIAEQNMAGIAAGLAKEGFIPFIYSIGNFPTLRCMEQIRYDICYHQLNVNIIAVGGGYAYGSLGTSHHTTEEIGMLRTIPELCVCAPADAKESKTITSMAVNDSQPYYIRLGKNGELAVHENENIKIEKGKPILIRQGEKVAVVATGSIVWDALDFVSQNKLDVSVYSVPFVKPMQKESFQTLFSQYDKIITMEEHQASAGFGSAILECLNDLAEENLLNNLPKIKRIAIPDTFSTVSGSQKYLKDLNGLVLKTEYFNL